MNTEILHLKYEDQTIQTSMSLGVATCVPGHSDKSQSLVSKADKALYQSKTNDRNKVIKTADP
ncbi:MAG: diguanylate cyclase [Desulfobacteraceae bacterium]|nr:diguanylate cyclase [Desulfobacteraceae bacterium]